MNTWLSDLEITGHKALTYVHDLAKGIRETRSKRLLEYSVDVENIWIEDNGRLRIMNYWTEGRNGRRGVPGLALLLYQLAANTDIPTSSISAYSFEMNRMFADLSDVIRERAVDLACRAYEGICTLTDFQQELAVLLDINGDSKETILTSDLPFARDMVSPSGRERKAAVRESHVLIEPKKGGQRVEERKEEGRNPGQSQTRISTVSDSKMAELSKLYRELFALRKWHLFATTGFGLLVLLIWISLRPHPDLVNDSKPQKIPTPVSTEASVNRTETPKPSASSSALPAKTSAPTPKSLNAEVQTEVDEVKAGIVPDLVTHTKEDAEKLAIASGLRYQFFLKSNAAAKGIVFKQDLTP